MKMGTVLKSYVITIIVLIYTLGCFPVAAGQLKQLTWDDLVPAHLLSDDPLADLSEEQKQLAYKVIDLLESLPPRGEPDTEEFYKEVDQAIPILKKAGIEIDQLMANRKQFRTAIVEALNGQQVRIPGYLLPLEVSADKSTEFLLVPYVGACIHVPPPPPNQIVYVKTDSKKGYKVKNLFQPVWVNGIITAQSMEKDLYLVDGSAGVDIGYSIKAARIEPYKE